jgi:hypothetical protein
LRDSDNILNNARLENEANPVDKLFADKLRDLDGSKESMGKLALSDDEKAAMWASIKSGIPAGKPVGNINVVKNKPLRNRIIYWSVAAAAAAVVAGIFFKTSSPNKSYIQKQNTPASEIIAGQPFRPEIKPMKTTMARNAQNYLASNDVREPVVELPYLTEEQSDVHVIVTEPVVKPYKKAEPKTAVQKKRTESFGYMTNFGAYQEREQRRNTNISYAVSSNISGGGKFDVSNNFIKSVAAQVGYVAPSSAPQIEQVSETTYSLPLNFAVQAHYKINNLITVGAGVSYTYLHSKYDGLINKKAYKIKQGIHYIGVPVNVYFNVLNSKYFYFYGNAGASIEKGVKVRYDMTTYDGTTKHANSHVKGVQFSINTGVGLEYKFNNDKMGVYLEPNLVYYFDSKIPASIRTDQPLQVEAEVGVRFHLK